MISLFVAVYKENYFKEYSFYVHAKLLVLKIISVYSYPPNYKITFYSLVLFKVLTKKIQNYFFKLKEQTHLHYNKMKQLLNSQ